MLLFYIYTGILQYCGSVTIISTQVFSDTVIVLFSYLRRYSTILRWCFNYGVPLDSPDLILKLITFYQTSSASAPWTKCCLFSLFWWNNKCNLIGFTCHQDCVKLTWSVLFHIILLLKRLQTMPGQKLWPQLWRSLYSLGYVALVSSKMSNF